MNSNIIEFRTENGETILIQASEKVISNSGGKIKVSATENGITKASQSFEKSISSIKHISGLIINSMKEVGNSPNEIEVKIGLTFSAEAGAIIAKASSEGSIELTLTWKKN